VQFYHHGRQYQYLTKVLDPQQLSLADIARRWDIELAFGVLKSIQWTHLMAICIVGFAFYLLS
jgi:hypothetical protein